MLEQRIEELTAAVKTLTLAIASYQSIILVPAFTGDPEDKGNDNIPNEMQKSEDITDTSQTSSPELPSATYDDVKRATNAVSKISRKKAIASLARFGVQSATKLAETQWAEYVAYMGKVAAGEIDPESSNG